MSEMPPQPRTMNIAILTTALSLRRLKQRMFFLLLDHHSSLNGVKNLQFRNNGCIGSYSAHQNISEWAQ